MENANVGIKAGGSRPTKPRKAPKPIKIYYSDEERIEVEARARLAGYGSIGLYLRAMERQRGELLYIKQEAAKQIAEIMRKYRLNKADLQAEGVLV